MTLRDPLDEVGLTDLAGREVHRHRELGREQPDLVPLRDGAARLGQRPLADRDDEPGVLGEPDERVRRHEPELGVLPAQQRLGADAARRSARSTIGWTTSRNSSRSMRALERVPRGRAGRAATERISSSKTSNRALPALLRLVHRGVGVVEQTSRACSPGPAIAMPRLAESRRSSPSRCSGALDRLEQPAGELDAPAPRRASRSRPVAQHRELVAAEARDDVARPHRLLQARARSRGAARRRRRGRGRR